MSPDVRREMCKFIRCCIPQHVQQFFDLLHEHLRRVCRRDATIDDVTDVYYHDLLSVRGQINLQHYEDRLLTVLGDKGFTIAIGILTEAAVNDGLLTEEAARGYVSDLPSSSSTEDHSFNNILYLLEHDGYLERHDKGYRFVSGLLEDWWRARHGQYFTPFAKT